MPSGPAMRASRCSSSSTTKRAANARAAWRRRQRAVPVRDVGAARYPARHLSMETSTSTARAWACGGCCASSSAAPAAHGVRRVDGAERHPEVPPPSWSSATRSHATAGAGSIPGGATRHRARAYEDGRGDLERLTGERAARLVHRARQPQHAPPGGRLRRLRIRQRPLRRRPAVLDCRSRTDGSARRTWSCRTRWTQRHALRAAAGLPHGNAFFEYLRDAFDVLYAEGATPEDDVGGHALPAARDGPGGFGRCSGFWTM